MASEAKFWEAQKDWSRRKHLVLSYYLKPAAPKLRKASPDGRVFILDGFAGRGAYGDNLAGSPIHTGQLTDECRCWNNPVDLFVRNVEPDPGNFVELEKRTKSWVNKGHVRNLQGTFQEQLPQVLAEAGESPLFAFLDPFKPKQLSFDDFAPLLDRPAITEICIVFFTPAIVRQVRALAPTARTSANMRAKLEQSLTRVFGGTLWRKLLVLPTVQVENVLGCFTEAIAAKASAVPRHICFIGWKAIEARQNVSLKYHIVFFTRHPEGVKLMNDAFFKETVDLKQHTTKLDRLTPQEQGAFDFGLDESDEESQAEARDAFVEQAILYAGHRNINKRWPRAGLMFEAMQRRFGECSETELRQAIQRLVHRTDVPRLVPITGGRQSATTKKWTINDETILAYEF